ncbi:MAG: hypothetical protein ACHQ1H_03230, partial [Nitrososphaerales archaeon]
MTSATTSIGGRTGKALPRVLVMGSPDQGNSHVRAWKLSGIRAEMDRKREWENSGNYQFLDICETEIRAREDLIRQAVKSKTKTILTGPVSNDFEFSSKILESMKKSENEI